MDTFTRAYLAAALWTATDGSDQGNPLDRDHDVSDFSPEALARAKRDCEAFCSQAGEWLDEWDREQAGHDFSLTRNGHGAGFWDRDRMSADANPVREPMPFRDELTRLAHSFGEVDVIVTDSGQLDFE